MSVSMSIKIFSVTKIAELLRTPQRCSRVTIQNQEMIVLLFYWLHTIEYCVMLHVSGQYWPFAVILDK